MSSLAPGALIDDGAAEELRSRFRGELIRVPNDVRRQLSNRHDEPLYVLAMGGAQPHEGRDGRAYHSWDEQGEGHAPQDVPLPDDLR